MEKVRANTNKANEIIWRYEYAMDRGITDIYQAYGRPSVYKVAAWNYCKELCREYNGRNLRIAGYNCMKFSATFQYVDGEGYVHYVLITKEHVRDTISGEIER